ncbi:hypothetical protein HOLleu_19227 [Holothuria leucospilota]|uniref:Uncharacterized protein n=1 Tax=Holothuria leucospilota TaxID=206669 RepID=A0A9Q1H4U7_HOLLE|nr:hypothetical protein HOLleu_19227 [Holothuria leucospilota]
MASPRSSVSEEIDLDLSASSSSFDEEEVLQYEDVEERADEEPAQGNQPYQFEPLADEAEQIEPYGSCTPAPGDDGERAA